MRGTADKKAAGILNQPPVAARYRAKKMIDLKSITKAFDYRPVLRSIDLSVGAGESVFLCGINGAGKSTLLRIAAGLLQPDRGAVAICGGDMASEPRKARPRLGFVSHKSMIYADLTVMENLLFAARLHALPEGRAAAERMLEEVGLAPYRYDRAAILSRGTMQRLSIARALIHRPSVLLADEPFTGLDGRASAHLAAVLDDFGRADRALLMTTHDAAVGLQCCRRVVVLHSGQIVFDSPTAGIDPGVFAKDYVAYAEARR